ncbi:MAG TPA: TonB-dependent receptor plug domain-containing protein [Paludibacter sp.]|nr:TonB-dependent receptor plug domain-containing protein [Paludibacter sp.]
MFKKVILCPNATTAFVFFSLFISGSAAQVVDQQTDTVHSKNLHEVLVNGQKTQSVRASLPVQIISEKELTTLNATNVADVAKHFAGVSVKDYGGIGGLKTVSIRGLGALHTGVSYDGVMMSDVQSGQIDLSRFSIENIAEVSLSNGQPNSLLQPARMFASSGVLSFSTQLPDYDKKHTFSGNITVKTGSFGLINPQIYIFKNVSEKWALSLSANGLTANGEYKFQSNLNRTGENLVEKNRINSDVHTIRTELNSTYHFNSFEYITLKINQYYSERGLPGADTYYISYATDRLLDKNYLAQFQYQNRQNCYFQYQFAGKFNKASMLFTEKSPNYPADINHTRTDNYAQNEYYLTSAFQTYFSEYFTASGSFDWWYNDLFSNSNLGFRQNASPTRHTGLANVAAKYMINKLTIGANLLYTLTRETNQTGAAAPNRDRLSPTVSVSYQPFNSKEIRFRAFYKNIFRLPTFNDLYYHDFGYAKLLPETTNQFNVGITYYETKIPFLSALECSVDAYYNRVTDKISIVYGMPYSTIRNIGRVDIKGCDVSLKTSKKLSSKNTINVSANYTYQLAQDYTTGTDTYLEIIPYTPIHSGSSSISFTHKNWEYGYNALFAGKRYSGQNSQKGNLLQPYSDHSLFTRYTYKKISMTVEALNLTNKNYEIVQFYPMPGRNYRFTLNYKF